MSFTSTGQRLRTDRTSYSVALEDSDRRSETGNYKGGQRLCQAPSGTISPQSVSQPLNQINDSGNHAAQRRQQEDDYAGNDELEFAVTIFVRRRKRALRKIRWRCVRGHKLKNPDLAYHGLCGERFGVGLALELVFRFPLALAFSCCFLSMSSACFLPSFIRCEPSLALSRASAARESFGSISRAF